MWFSDTLMGGMTQALRTRPSVGARRQGYKVRGCLSLGTPAEGHKLCNEGERPSPAQQRPGLPHHSPDVPSLDARPSPCAQGRLQGQELGGMGSSGGQKVAWLPGPWGGRGWGRWVVQKRQLGQAGQPSHASPHFVGKECR